MKIFLRKDTKRRSAGKKTDGSCGRRTSGRQKGREQGAIEMAGIFEACSTRFSERKGRRSRCSVTGSVVYFCKCGRRVPDGLAPASLKTDEVVWKMCNIAGYVGNWTAPAWFLEKGGAYAFPFAQRHLSGVSFRCSAHLPFSP